MNRVDTLRVRYEVVDQGKVEASFSQVSGLANRLGDSLGKVSTQAKKASDDVNKLDFKTLSPQQLFSLNKGLADFRNRGKEVGLTANEMRYALRGVPAQFTDIATSLASGQRPLQVLLQQGGQLKDMFGGTGAAARALIGYLTTLINPVTVLAAGGIGLAAAWNAAEQEQAGFIRATVLTGNAIGATSDDLANMAFELDNLRGVTRGAAADVVAKVAETGRFTGEQIKLVSAAALQLERDGVQAIDKTVQQFKRLADDPVNAAIELNKQYHFLTQAVFDQIRALEKQGEQTEAARVAIDAYGQEMARRTQTVSDNLTTLGKAAQATGNFFKEMWDAAVGLFVKESPEQQIARLQKLVDAAQKGEGIYSQASDRARSVVVEKIKAQILALRSGINYGGSAPGQVNPIDLDHGGLSSEKAAAQVKYDQEGLRYATDRVKMERDIAAARALGAAAGKSDLEIERRVSEIRASYARKGANKADPGGDLVSRVRQQVTLNEAQADSETRLTATQRLRIEVEEKLHTLGAKVSEGDRKEIAALLDKADATDAVNKKKAEEASLQQLLIRLQQSASEQGARDAFDLEAMQHGRDYVEVMQRRMAIDREYDRQKAELDRRAAARGASVDYNAELAKIDAFHTAALEAEGAFQQARKALQGDWRTGARAAAEDFITQNENMAGSAYDSLSGLFNSLGDAVADFGKRGSQSISEFVESAIEDFIRLEARIAISNGLKALLGMFLGGGTATAGASGFGNNTGWLTDGSYGGNGGAGFSLTANAKGGTYSSPSLHRYVNGVYDKPQFFAFAQGGVFAEDGEEAVMPLTRGPGGTLGVRNFGGGSGGVNVNIYGAPSNPEVNVRQGKDGLDIEVIFGGLEKRLAGRVASGEGDLYRAQKQRFGLKEPI